MYASDSDNENPRPDVQEMYAGAVSTGVSRVQEKPTRADLIASAGMSIHSTGTALMRLVSEWNSGAVPRERELPLAKSLALQAAQRREQEAIAADIAEGKDVKAAERRGRIEAATVTKADMELAEADLRLMAARVTDWSLEEAKLRFQRLKTLGTVRGALIFWVQERGWDDAEYLVAKVLQYFLSPYCPACGGSGVREFAGNNRRGAGKACLKCRDHAVRGEQNVPCHGRGKAPLAHIRSCVARAAKEVGEGTRRMQFAAEEERRQFRRHETIRRLQRADAEAKADEAQDRAAVAEAFRSSLGARRR